MKVTPLHPTYAEFQASAKRSGGYINYTFPGAQIEPRIQDNGDGSYVLDYGNGVYEDEGEEAPQFLEWILYGYLTGALRRL